MPRRRGSPGQDTTKRCTTCSDSGSHAAAARTSVAHRAPSAVNVRRAARYPGSDVSCAWSSRQPTSPVGPGSSAAARRASASWSVHSPSMRAPSTRRRSSLVPRPCARAKPAMNSAAVAIAIETTPARRGAMRPFIASDNIDARPSCLLQLSARTRDTCPSARAGGIFSGTALAARAVQGQPYMSTMAMEMIDRGKRLDYGFRPMRNVAWYKRAQAWILSRGNKRYDAMVAEEKRALLAPLSGTVLEIGPGGGNNLAFLRPGVSWIGVEPNPFFHDRLRARGERLGIAVDV